MTRSPGLPRGTNILVALGAATLTAIGISSIKGILAPVLLTLILTICANPVRTGLLKRGVPGGIATGSVILVVFGLLAGFTYTLILATAQFVAMLPNYQKQFEQIGASIGAWLTSIGVGPEQVQAVEKGLTPTNLGHIISSAALGRRCPRRAL